MTAAARLPIFVGVSTSGFYTIHSTCIDFGKDDLGLRFGAGRAMSQPSELLLSFVPSFVEGAATRGLPGREVSSQVSEVCNNFYAAFDVLPYGGLEPSSDFVGASKVITFIWCYPRSHFMQVLVRGI